jgi:benzodiazapine receptor
MKIPGKTQMLVIAATLLTLLVNVLADALPLNGRTTADVSDQFDSFFTPAGYVFAIWAVIYLGLLVFSWYQSRPEHLEHGRVKQISGLYMASCAANVAWLFFWHYNLFALAFLAMAALLICLILIYRRLRPGRKDAPRTEKWMLDIPFEIYLGWISVATIANAADVLIHYHWDGFGIEPVTWATILLTAGALLVVMFYIAQKNLVLPIVFIWAYIGIGVKFSELRQYSLSAWVMAILIAFMIYTLDLGKKIQAGSEIPPPGPTE